MTAIEHELIEKISHLDVNKQRQVLEFVRSLEESAPSKHYSALELMSLPLTERNALVERALERSENDETELFDAYSESEIDK